MKRISEILAFMMGVFIPFPTLGPAIAADFTASPALFLGTLFVAVNVGKIFTRKEYLVSAALMIACFVLSNVGRNPLESYALSLLTMLISISPLLLGDIASSVRRANIMGFMAGLAFTILLASIEFAGSVLAIDSILSLLDSIFPDGRRGSPAPYLRPKAGFFEPSHLAIYLTFAFIIADLVIMRSRFKNIVKAVVALCVLYVGSLAGILLLAVYVASSWILKIFRDGRSAVLSIVFGTWALAVTLIYWDDLTRSTLLQRLGIVVDALSQGDLIGSEASRVNAFTPVFEYWSQNGWGAFLIGTGYSNYSDWLIYNFGVLGVLSSAGRGDIDNIFAAVLISTGIIGLTFYIAFIISRFYFAVECGHKRVAVFIIAVHFAYGHMTSYLIWYLLFVLANALELRSDTQVGWVRKSVFPRDTRSVPIPTADRMSNGGGAGLK